eukprot:RCo016545
MIWKIVTLHCEVFLNLSTSCGSKCLGRPVSASVAGTASPSFQSVKPSPLTVALSASPSPTTTGETATPSMPPKSTSVDTVPTPAAPELRSVAVGTDTDANAAPPTQPPQETEAVVELKTQITQFQVEIGELQAALDRTTEELERLRQTQSMPIVMPSSSGTHKFGLGLTEGTQHKADLGVDPDRTDSLPPFLEVLSSFELEKASEYSVCPLCDAITSDMLSHCRTVLHRCPQPRCSCAAKSVDLRLHFETSTKPVHYKRPRPKKPRTSSPPPPVGSPGEPMAGSGSQAQLGVDDEKAAVDEAFLAWVKKCVSRGEFAQPTMQLVVQQSRGFTEAFLARHKATGSTLGSLSFDNVAAVHTYTLETEIYRTVNSVLMRLGADWETQLERWREVVLHVDQGLAALEPFQVQTPLYRGINRHVAENLYSEGQVIVWPAFSSTTTDPEVAKHFIEQNQGTFFIINPNTTGCHGRFISALSAFEKEQEVLFRYNSYFRVLQKMGSG